MKHIICVYYCQVFCDGRACRLLVKEDGNAKLLLPKRSRGWEDSGNGLDQLLKINMVLVPDSWISLMRFLPSTVV